MEGAVIGLVFFVSVQKTQIGLGAIQPFLQAWVLFTQCVGGWAGLRGEERPTTGRTGVAMGGRLSFMVADA